MNGYITEYVPETAWTQAEATIEDLPLFILANFLDKTLTKQTAVAKPDVQNYAENTCQYADEIGLKNIYDAPLTIAVWRCLYGKDFMNLLVTPWAADIR